MELFNKNIVLKIPLWVVFVSLSVIYLVWELYWFKQVGYLFIKWHTHLAVFFYLWLLVFIFGKLINKYFSRGYGDKFLLICSSVLFVLFFVELYFIVSKKNRTYLEKVGNNYFSPYQTEHDSHYHIWPTESKEHWLDKPEYKFWRPTNSLGFPDIEWEKEDFKNKKKILFLGDSFTEGDGAEFDSSFVSILRDSYLSDSNLFIMNGGVIGSDPFFDFVALKGLFTSINPDIVIQSISTQDMLTDIIIRGGMERFNDKKLKYLPAPWWEPIYALNYTSRLIFTSLGYNELLRKGNKPNKEEIDFLNKTILNLLEQYILYCEKNNIILKFYLRPDREEIMKRNYAFDFSLIENYLETQNIELVNLLPCFLKHIEDNENNVAKYFWKKDGHHNAKGYNLMANCVYSELFNFE